MALTGRAGLLALASVFVVAFAAPSRAGLALASLAVVLLVALDVALAPAVRRLTFARAGDTSVRLGNQASVRLTVTNPTGRRVRGALRDGWSPSAGALTQRHPLDVPPGQRRVVETVLVPTRRGDRRSATVTVRAAGPLGLGARQGSHTVPWRLRVLHPFGARKHLPSKLARLRELDGRTSVMVRGQGTEFDSLREYVIGDDVRSIDWRATARRADVVVRTWRPERDRHLLLLVDTGRLSAGRVGDVPRLDAALDAALLLAALAVRAGDRVDLLAYDRRVRARVQGVAAGSVLAAIVDATATVEPELIEADMSGMVATALRQLPRRSLVVLFTGLEPAPVEDGLLPVLAHLVRRHTVVVAAVADPRVDELAARRGTAEGVYEAAAAAQARLERGRITDLLARRGVEVVDAPPEALPPQLADRYLTLKAAGRL